VQNALKLGGTLGKEAEMGNPVESGQPGGFTGPVRLGFYSVVRFLVGYGRSSTQNGRYQDMIVTELAF